MSYDQLKEEYKAQILYYVNKCQLTSITTCINTLLNVTFLNYKFILNTNKRCPVFATPSFALNMIFSSMLSMCLVYIRKFSECITAV
jgi:hypothetical protein